MKRLVTAIGLAALHLAVLPALAGAQALTDPPAEFFGFKGAQAPRDARSDAKLLARAIDRLINNSWKDTDIKPAPRADDTTFLRRLHLDLSGRIPSLLDVRDFLDNDDANKREQRIDQLLDGIAIQGQQPGEAYARHFASFWRHVMLQGTNNSQFQGLEPGFEAWLRGKLQSNTHYDKLVQEILLSQGGGPGMRGGFPGPGGAGSPQVFFLANENKPENLAGATSRVFLGVKLECAQCHAHPFAKWTRNQFWEYAAFFSGIQQFNPGRGRPAGFNPNSRTIKIPNTDKVVKAKYLTGVEPKWQDGVPSIKVLSDWVTTSENPYFARAAVDHVWSYFFGVSLLEPILEPNPDSPPAHPELLDLLAREFAAHDFDLKFLIRAIALTDAYARSSGTITAHKHEIELFARMPVRGISPEQLFDSIAEATDYTDPYQGNMQMQVQQFNGGPLTPRQLFLSKFTSQDRRTETHTSILQALFMMNGKFLAERTKLENNKSLFTIATAPTSNARRVETLYLLVLSRMPRPEESARMVRYIEGGGPSRDQRQAVADVYWALLNSGEFMLNH
jgi:hypothetical protein